MRTGPRNRLADRIANGLLTAVAVATGYVAAKHGWLIGLGLYAAFIILCLALYGALTFDQRDKRGN